ncbi:MAG: ribosomal subunit interface protein [Anaerolinea sp.]|nr:ribosomal subunit interface protein [Anaerolinea sp.]
MEDTMTTKLEIFGKNMEISDRIREYVSKKAVKFDRMLTNMDDVKVDLAYVKSARSVSDRQVAQITIRGKGYILRTEERSDDIFAAYDAAIEKMQRQIERYKGKHYKGRGDGRSVAEVTEIPAEAQEPVANSIIMRRKIFKMVPMDELEAIEQMNLLGHEDFFVFYNVATNSLNVLYHRRDGSYGLIMPDIG